MNYQQSIFGEEQALNDQPSYQGGSRVSRIALQESVKRLVTSVISGLSIGESLAKLGPHGLWLKMYQGYYQAKMDGSFEEYSEILPTWGLMLDGVLYQPQALAPHIDETGWRLLPTPTASDWHSATIRKNGTLMMSNMREFLHFHCNSLNTTTTYPHPAFVEQVMGYKIGHTDLNV